MDTAVSFGSRVKRLWRGRVKSFSILWPCCELFCCSLPKDTGVSAAIPPDYIGIHPSIYLDDSLVNLCRSYEGISIRLKTVS